MPTFFNYPDLQERLIVLDGWSKAYSMTGWRMGWSVWPEKLIPHVTKLAINSFSCVNAPSQFAGIAALDGPDDSIYHMMEKFDQRRKLIHKGLNDLPGVTCSLPGGAFYAFPNVSGTGMNGSEFSKKCMHEAGVAIVPGTAFGATSIDFVRFSFAASQDNIQKALEKIKKMLG
jgi:aspartate/methionine/tyrosine aminotransferase